MAAEATAMSAMIATGSECTSTPVTTEATKMTPRIEMLNVPIWTLVNG
jgi:hypothetical protein